MNAKEIIEICVAEIAGNGKYELAEQLQREYDSLIMELAKSKEEAGERYAKACVKLRDSRMGIRLTEEEEKALRLAAFGKEDEG